MLLFRLGAFLLILLHLGPESRHLRLERAPLGLPAVVHSRACLRSDFLKIQLHGVIKLAVEIFALGLAVHRVAQKHGKSLVEHLDHSIENFRRDNLRLRDVSLHRL